jgi:lipopolysaccharide export LptBFGC system permease protein LptF
MPNARHHIKKEARKRIWSALISAPYLGINNLELGNFRIHFDRYEDGYFINTSIARIDSKTGDIAEFYTASKTKFSINEASNLIVAELNNSLTEIFNTSKVDNLADRQSYYGIQGKVMRTIMIDELIKTKIRKLGELPSNAIYNALSLGIDLNEPVNEIETELAKRYSMAFSPFFFSIIAPFLGIIVKSDSKITNIACSVLPTMAFYYPATAVLEILSVKGYANHLLIMFMANIFLFAVAIILYKKCQ